LFCFYGIFSFRFSFDIFSSSRFSSIIYAPFPNVIRFGLFFSSGKEQFAFLNLMKLNHSPFIHSCIHKQELLAGRPASKKKREAFNLPNFLGWSKDG